MLLANAVVSALVNLLIVAGVPFFVYCAYHKWRHQRACGSIAQQAGMQLGKTRYLIPCLVLALTGAIIIAVWPPPLVPITRIGSPQRAFLGLGLSRSAVVTALLYGVVQTAFTEELLFRGLIAGSLSRRFRLPWANLGQALIFLLPHVPVLRIMPEMWPILPIIFVSALFLGWVRIKSGSMIGPWMVHASLNVAMCLGVAVRSAT